MKKSTNNFKDSNEFLIIGAGLVGINLSILLIERGERVVIIEKRTREELFNPINQRTINLTLSIRGIESLRNAGLIEEVLRMSIPLKGRKIHLGKHVYPFKYESQNSKEVYAIRRSDLHRHLIQVAEKKGVKILYNTECININSDTKVSKLKSADEIREVESDFIVGCDGTNSVVASHKEFGRKIKKFPFKYKEFRISGKEAKTQKLDIDSIHIFPVDKAVFVGIPNSDASFNMLYFYPEDFEELSDDQVMGKLSSEKNLSSLIIDNFIVAWRSKKGSSLSSVQCSKYFDNKSTIIMGDAAHSILPFLGQGLNSGLEDCTILINLINKFRKWETTFREFEKVKIPSADAIMRMSEKNFFELMSGVKEEKFYEKNNTEDFISNALPHIWKKKHTRLAFTNQPYDKIEMACKEQDSIIDTMTDLKLASGAHKKSIIPFILNSTGFREKNLKTIGLIGGMSWLSTQDYYRVINETIYKKRGGLYSGRILLSSINFIELESLQRAGLWDMAKVYLENECEKLLSAGVDFVGICSNTGNEGVDRFKENIKSKVIHIGTPLGIALKKNGVHQVLLLGTKYTMSKYFLKNHLKKYFNIKTIVPNAKERDRLNIIIYQELCVGKIEKNSETFMLNLINRYMPNVDGVILGCTELEILYNKIKNKITHNERIYDTTTLHGEFLANLSIGEV